MIAQPAGKANPSGRGKLYALHAPEVECIGKGKARRPYEFGVDTSLAVTHGQGLSAGARTFPGNLYDCHILAAQLEQTNTLLQDLDVRPTAAVVDLGYRGVNTPWPPRSTTCGASTSRAERLARNTSKPSCPTTCRSNASSGSLRSSG